MFRLKKEKTKNFPALKKHVTKSIKEKYQKARIVFMTIYSIFVFSMPVFASENPTAGAAIGNLLGVVATIFRYVGVALFAWGAIQFILATKDQMEIQKLMQSRQLCVVSHSCLSKRS